MMGLSLLTAILCFLRVSAFVAFLPPFGGQHIPSLVKGGAVLAFTVFWLPGAMNPRTEAVTQGGETHFRGAPDLRLPAEVHTAVSDSGSPRWLLWIWLGAREVILGASLGWLLGMVLIPMRIAGSWLAEQIGLDIASIAAGTDTGSGNVLAVILESCGVLLLYSLNLHHDFLRIFDRTFEMYPAGKFSNLPESSWIIGTLTRLPERGLMIAAPAGLLLILILIVLLFAMKQSPQFSLFTFGMPFRLAAGLIAITVMFPEMLVNVMDHLRSTLLSPT